MNSKLIQLSYLMIGCVVLFAGCSAKEVSLPQHSQVTTTPEVVPVERNLEPVSHPETQSVPIPRASITKQQPEPEVRRRSKKNDAYSGSHQSLIEERLDFYRGVDADPGSVTDSGFTKGNFYFISREWQQCRSLYDFFVEKYTLLAGGSQTQRSSKDLDLARIYRKDFQFHSSGCVDILAGGVYAPYGRLGGEVKEQVIADLNRQLDSRQYEKVLITFEKLQRISVDEKQPVEVLDTYGKALLRVGKIDDAVKVYHLMAEVTVTEDYAIEEWTVQRLLADLLLVSGQQEASRQQYEGLVSSFAGFSIENNKALSQLAFLENGSISKREFKNYLGILQGSLSYGDIPSALRLLRATDDFQRRYPFSPVIQGVVEVKEKTEKQLRVWTGEELQKVDELIEQQEFDQARQSLNSLMLDDQPFTLQDVIRKTMDDVVVAEAKEQERVFSSQQRELEHQWMSATYLLDTRQYDDAIKGYELLLGTKREEKARFKIQESMNAAANGNRKEAANFFIRATKTLDPDKKVELLLSSHKLLKDILVRYPQANLVDKVSQNLSVLESQLDKIDPALLKE